MLKQLSMGLLISLLTVSPCAAGTFRAGAASADITPANGVLLDGPISKNGPVTMIGFMPVLWSWMTARLVWELSSVTPA